MSGLGFLRFVVSIGGLRPPIETTNPKNPKPATFQTKIALSFPWYAVYLISRLRHCYWMNTLVRNLYMKTYGFCTLSAWYPGSLGSPRPSPPTYSNLPRALQSLPTQPIRLGEKEKKKKRKRKEIEKGRAGWATRARTLKPFPAQHP